MKPMYRKIILAVLGLVVIWFLGKFVLPFLLPIIGRIVKVLTPFFVAVFLSSLLEPLIKFFHIKLRFNRTLAVTTSMLLLFGGFFLVMGIIIVRLIAELIDLAQYLPAYQESLTTLGRRWLEQGKQYYQIGTNYGDGNQLNDLIQNNIGPLTNTLQNWVTNTADSLINFATLIPGGVTTIVTVSLIVVLGTFFISRDRQLIVRTWLKYAPKPVGVHTLNVIASIFTAFIGWLKAMAVLMSLTMILGIVGLTLIGSKYAVTVGLLLGILDLIPVLGQSSVFLPWIIYSFVTGSTGTGIKLAMLWLLILAVRQIMENKVISENLGLHPLVTLLAMYAGLQFFGFLGLVGGPILVVAIQATFQAINKDRT